MSFKWDWDKKELVEGESPDREFELPIWVEPFILPSCVAIGWAFIQFIAPWLGHLLLGGWL